MNAEPQRHFVIAIYGVGNPAAGDVERTLDATLNAVMDATPFEVHEFDWNAFAVHAPRTQGRLWRYAQWFSGSFASAAWVRTSRPTKVECARAGVDAIAHSLWAATQSMFGVMVLVGVALYLLGLASDFLSSWIRPLTTAGVLPSGVGWRASVLGNQLLGHALSVMRYGGATTAGLLGMSISAAALEALVLRSTRPLAVTARRHAFIVLLVPCVLLSLFAFRRESDDEASPFAMMQSGWYWFVMALSIAGMAVVSIFLGGARTTLAWTLMMPVLLAVLVVGSLLIRFLRATAGPVWLAPAKVLLDIALYVGTPSHRNAIQDHLNGIIAGIPDRSTTAIWIVAHSLGSVIALDSLTSSDVWQSTDRVRLVTLGPPIRRFFIRFFPGAFFEPQIDTAARTVAGRVGEFTWLNAFRRFDYVGKALGFRKSGLDLPTRQFWPAHANYWGDARVARTVFDGWQRATAVAPAKAVKTTRLVSPVSVEVPKPLMWWFRFVAVACGLVLLAITGVNAYWLLFPGLGGMVVRPPIQIETPASTTARVRHERGFSGDGARIHEFRFDFRDDSSGREHHVEALVPGFFGLWSDPRFDYLALARFIRADCKPERVAHFYEFGWSVPCSRADVPISYDPADPNRFQVVGFENAPGYLVRAMRTVLSGVLVGLALVVMTLVVPVLWLGLWSLFVGDPLLSEVVLGAWLPADDSEDAVETEA